MLLAAAVALPVQIVAFSALVRFRKRFTGFLAVWAGGILVRMAIVISVSIVALRVRMDGAVAALLALAGFFFLLLLLEPFYFRFEPAETIEAR
jgi:hypothetical protein